MDINLIQSHSFHVSRSIYLAQVLQSNHLSIPNSHPCLLNYYIEDSDTVEKLQLRLLADDSTEAIRCSLGEVPTELILYYDGLPFSQDKNKYMILLVKLSSRLLFCTLFAASFSIHAQEFNPQLTEYGQPDFRGVWYFSNKTPLERPERFGDQEFLTDEELTSLLQSRVERVAATG